MTFQDEFVQQGLEEIAVPDIGADLARTSGIESGAGQVIQPIRIPGRKHLLNVPIWIT